MHCEQAGDAGGAGLWYRLGAGCATVMDAGPAVFAAAAAAVWAQQGVAVCPRGGGGGGVARVARCGWRERCATTGLARERMTWDRVVDA